MKYKIFEVSNWVFCTQSITVTTHRHFTDKMDRDIYLEIYKENKNISKHDCTYCYNKIPRGNLFIKPVI